MSAEHGKMILGIQPTGWTNDDFQEIGDDTPYQEILDQTKEALFEGGSTGHNYPGHPPSLLEALSRRELKISSTWASTAFTTCVDRVATDAAFKDFQDQVAFLERVGAKDIVVAELARAVNADRTKAVLKDRPILEEADWYLLTDLLNRAGEYAKAKGMQLSYHPHVGTCVMTIKETETLLKNTDEKFVGLCLDTAHLRFGGATQEQLEALTKEHAGRITHVHLKNVRGEVLKEAKSRNFSFYQAIKRGIFTVPGDPEGELNLDPIMDTLKSVNYSGWMVIEAEQLPHRKYDPAHPKRRTSLQYAHMARGYLRDQLGY